MQLLYRALLFLCVVSTSSIAESPGSLQPSLNEDLHDLIEAIEQHYIYLPQKQVDMACIKSIYTEKAKTVTSAPEALLLFEYLLNEFYDNHIHLNANNAKSYRLKSPFYAEVREGKAYIKNTWASQLANLDTNVLGAEILSLNGIAFSKAIDSFPARCRNKSQPAITEWTANKILAGRYHEPRILGLKLKNGSLYTLNMDDLLYKKTDGLLEKSRIGSIGIIRIHDTLGDNSLIKAFDTALDALSDTTGLIIDLRNTPSGGNSYVGRGILSRFTDKEIPFQRHKIKDEQYDGETNIHRSWAEYAGPRGKHYNKPVVILAGRWTGSMGEGLVMGFDTLDTAHIVGTELRRLAGGSTGGFAFKNRTYGFTLTTEMIFHVDGTPRETFIPEHYIEQKAIHHDPFLDAALKLLQ